MSPNLTELLLQLVDSRVELILAGGLAAVAQGAPVTTFDVDIVHHRSPDNVDRLLSALEKLGAHVRDPANRMLRPTREALLGAGHSLLVTDLGPLDCLGAIEHGLDYDALLPFTIVVDFSGRPLRVLTLEKLTELKETWPDDESKLRAALLRRTLTRPR